MHKVYFYKDNKGNQPVLDYIRFLSAKNDKDSRINLNKILDYIKILKEYGIGAGEPYIKHLEDDIWEIRPIKNRILFVAWNGDSYILLHYFIKQTRKTPKDEIKKAKKEFNKVIERKKKDE